MKEYDFYEGVVVRMLDRHRFPLPWSVEETPACFVVRANNGQALAHAYYEDNSTTNLLTRQEAWQMADEVAKLSRAADGKSSNNDAVAFWSFLEKVETRHIISTTQSQSEH